MTESEKHCSGFVNILGRANVGKSTLMNALMGEKLSIITSKPQTTRHRIHGMINGKNYQIVLSDTPGVITDPAYPMQESMNAFAWSVIEDADVLLFIADPWVAVEVDEKMRAKFEKVEGKILFLLNKTDQKSEEEVQELLSAWEKVYAWDDMHCISALKGKGISALKDKIICLLPEGPAYYPKEQYTDKSERFFVEEMIREKALGMYKKEIPYAIEVHVHWFKRDEEATPPIIRIGADIYVERATQKSIVIGKGGSKIKQLGIAARKDIEEFLQCKIYLELLVKVKKDWRSNERDLKNFGYRG